MEYLSCELVENGICFLVDSVVICCYAMSIGYEGIKLADKYDGQAIDWDDVIEAKQKLRESFTQNIHKACSICPRLKFKDWGNNGKINYFLINHWDKCSLNCIYCYTRHNKKELNNAKPYKMLPILKDAVKNKILEDGCRINITGGEPTELKEFPDLMKYILNETNFYILVNTSGYNYSKWIRKGLEIGRVSPTISLDAGTRETYKKIKNVDGFKTVVENIKKYKKGLDPVKNSLFSLKYIFIPEYNDTLEAVQSWLKLVEDLNVTNLKLEIEHEWYLKNRYVPDNIKDYINIVIEYAHKHKCNQSFREMFVHCGYLDEIYYIDNGIRNMV